MNRTKLNHLPFADKDSTHKVSRRSTVSRWANVFRPRRRRHDPMLVLSMSDFNFADSWERILNPIKSHENGI